MELCFLTMDRSLIKILRIFIFFILTATFLMVNVFAREDLYMDATLKVWDDGTAFVVGQVEDHQHRCEVDGACSLKLEVNDKDVVVVYAEGDIPGPHGQVGFHGGNKGDWIKTFGAYSKEGNVDTIRLRGSTDYFVIDAQDGTPLGPVTERFFAEVARLKGEVIQTRFREAKMSGKWSIYRNEEFGYEFRYPSTWTCPQVSEGDPNFYIYYPDPSAAYSLTLKNAHQLDKNLETNDCVAHNEKPRCEILDLNQGKIIIDWGISGSGKASVLIEHPTKPLQAVFELTPTTEEAKAAFRPILSTFKFMP